MNFCLLNMLNNIKNGQKSKKAFILQKKTSSQILMLNELWKEGFILGYKIINLKKKLQYLKIFLKYYSSKNLPVINSIITFTKPGKKAYCSVKNLWKLNSHIGVIFVSTNKGILKSNECKRLGVGGELLCLIK